MQTTLERWSMPDSYFGASWSDYYSAGVGQSRDSDALERSNFRTMLTALGGESDTVLVIRESHWAVNWVEWIAIHESDHAALKIAGEQKARLENHPVLDEDDWSNLECEEACAYWERMSVRDRAECIKSARCGASIFAARRAALPEDNSGALLNYLNGN